jgi:hypothetical protein
VKVLQTFRMVSCDYCSVLILKAGMIGIPGLPRVLDALSTIMWPSMQTKMNDRGMRSASKRGAGNDLDWANSETLDLADADLVIETSSNNRAVPTTSRMRREMEELTKWLEEEEEKIEKRDDPWKNAASSHEHTGDLVSSPGEIKDSDKHRTLGGPASNAFDDDFTMFVSAPPEPVPAVIGGPSAPDESFDSLAPESSGIMYHSLGSASDLGDVSREKDKGSATDSEEEDDHLPSQEEISQSATRIFGSSNDFPESYTFDDESEFTSFDLTKVFGALQGMKEEISGIEDEAERRKAAARAALGLVYGLERKSP